MKALTALLQFTTILPLGEPADFEAFARKSWMYPIAGYVTGALCMIPGLLAWFFGFDNSMLVAAVTLALAIFITGANHFDGLLDFGDGLMAHGGREKRIRAMTDRTTGAGALALGIFVVLISFAALSQMPPIFIAISILCAEVCGKMSMGLSSALGKPFHEGIQKFIYDNSKRRYWIYTILLACPLIFFGKFGIAAILCGIAVFFIMWLAARRLFGGSNGDVTGATCELTKMMVFVLICILLSV
ncbi:MAG TPA: adenosylcobinamide-GDP ribazoletransferase [Methanocorpusculum sp.]|nr:adenosylcobinamide-GDP ribazoletransferase [Methanocorpusculum sp.]